MGRAFNPVIAELLIGVAVLVLALLITFGLDQISAAGVLLSLGLYALMAALIWRGRGTLSVHFGWANRVTLLRAVLLVWLAGWLMFSYPSPERLNEGAWPVVAAALIILVLDGVDGQLARRLNQTSEFGARFDMEVDAALILLLSLGLMLAGRAGPWVLLIGLMRYAFVLAMPVWPWLGAPLPASFRRKLVCVWQVAGLIIAFVPGLPAGLVTAALLSALVLLILSFALDILWLYRRRTASHSH